MTRRAVPPGALGLRGQVRVHNPGLHLPGFHLELVSFLAPLEHLRRFLGEQFRAEPEKTGRLGRVRVGQAVASERRIAVPI